MSRRLAVAALVLIVLFAADSRADIYRWEDDAGTVHFTDDLTNVPARFRGKAHLVVREPPRPPEPAPPPDRGIPRLEPSPSPENEADARERDREGLASEVEQLKAKIAAKEKLIQTVDERRNLALNPLRSRVLDPGDVDLYRKYQAELPEDRERLRDLESRLELLK